jgi:hypothetical protein
MDDVKNAGQSIVVKNAIRGPVSEVDCRDVTVTENWGRLFLSQDGKSDIVIVRDAYPAFIAAIQHFTPASDGRAEGLREAAGIAEAFMSQWATATYQNMDARMQNAAKTYAAGDIVSAIRARAAELEGKTDE